MIRSLEARKVVLSHVMRSVLAHLRGLYPGNEVVTALEHAFRAED